MIVRAALAAAALAACTGGSPHPSASGPVPITRTPAPHLAGRALAVVDIPQYEEDNIGFLWMRR
ncbi:hypothetical protein GCM10023195_81520 [Actinoallomurus liliacearum]|uniref:Uncharacterized protein n=1 Tax=Actinoallomurus liliacearum TaxID=1080073 RepID=A0ABP8TY91_9ACTN